MPHSSPYQSPRSTGDDNVDIHVNASGGNRLILLTALFAFLVGLFGMFGVYAYAAEPRSNPSRYQLTILPILAFIVGLPAMLLGLFDLWRNRSTVVGLSRLIYFACFMSPAISIGGLVITDWVQNGG